MQENSHTNKIVKLKNKETYDLEGHRIWEFGVKKTIT